MSGPLAPAGHGSSRRPAGNQPRCELADGDRCADHPGDDHVLARAHHQLDPVGGAHTDHPDVPTALVLDDDLPSGRLERRAGGGDIDVVLAAERGRRPRPCTWSARSTRRPLHRELVRRSDGRQPSRPAGDEGRGDPPQLVAAAGSGDVAGQRVDGARPARRGARRRRRGGAGRPRRGRRSSTLAHTSNSHDPRALYRRRSSSVTGRHSPVASTSTYGRSLHRRDAHGHVTVGEGNGPAVVGDVETLDRTATTRRVAGPVPRAGRGSPMASSIVDPPASGMSSRP